MALVKKATAVTSMQVLQILNGEGYEGSGKVRVITYDGGKIIDSRVTHISTGKCNGLFEGFVRLGEEMLKLQKV